VIGLFGLLGYSPAIKMIASLDANVFCTATTATHVKQRQHIFKKTTKPTTDIHRKNAPTFIWSLLIWPVMMKRFLQSQQKSLLVGAIVMIFTKTTLFEIRKNSSYST
jgi:hypothetical protein